MCDLKKIETRELFEVATCTASRWAAPADGRLRVADGRIWLTRENDPVDYWLDASGRHTLALAEGDVLWIGSHGEEPARVEFATDARAAAPLRARLTSLWSMMRLGSGTTGALLARH